VSIVGNVAPAEPTAKAFAISLQHLPHGFEGCWLLRQQLVEESSERLLECAQWQQVEKACESGDGEANRKADGAT
jgi:hypothetical protein